MASTSRIMKDLIDPANFDPRDYDMIKDLNDTKFLWKIAVRIVDLWYVQKPPKPGHLEMIFMDSKGDKIQVSVKKEEFVEWHEKLKEHHTYEIHNFAVVPNDLTYKACTHPYRLNFNCGTTLREKHFEDIPFFEYDFKSFSDILGGKYRTDISIDVIGAVEKLPKSQPNANAKMVSFIIKDLWGEYMNCTLWDQLAIKFMNYCQKANESDLTVIILTHARIKEPQGNYSVTVSNSWNGSRLLINEDILEIHNFKKRFGDVEVVQPSSQRLTQMTGYSQFSEQEKFMYKAQVMSIEDISKVIDSKEITAVTVGTVVTFIIGKTGWYYQGCSGCTRSTMVTDGPFKCPCDRYNEHSVPRYKLEVKIVHKKGSGKFIFWDQHCAEIIGITAADLRNKMLEMGEDNPKVYPLILDHITARTFALRVKVQPTYGNCSVIKYSENQQIIKGILDQLQSDEDISKPENANPEVNESVKPVAVTPTLDKEKSSIFDSVQFNTQSLSATGDYDPDSLGTVTPAKRMSSAVNTDDVVHSQDLAPAQLSSTKTTKYIKSE